MKLASAGIHCLHKHTFRDTVPSAVATRPKQAGRPAVWHPCSPALCICGRNGEGAGQQKYLMGSSCLTSACAAHHGLHVCTPWASPGMQTQIWRRSRDAHLTSCCLSLPAGGAAPPATAAMSTARAAAGSWRSCSKPCPCLPACLRCLVLPARSLWPVPGRARLNR